MKRWQKAGLLFLKTKEADDTSRNIDRGRNLVLLFLFYGSFSVSILFFTALLQSYFLAGHHYVIGRIWACVISLLFMTVTYLFVRQRQYRYASYVLVGFYGFVATSIAWRWGINLPSGLLFSCVTIVLAGMLIGPSSALYTAAILVAALGLLQAGISHNLYHPDISWTARQSNYGDIAGYAVVFALLALVSWLFGREIARSFARAEQAEADLLQEKLLLESRVVERTAKIRVMQLEKVQQLHRFAELGQLSTAMMHELANHLTNLSLDIEGLHGQQRSDALKRARHSLRYIDTMTKNVSKRLHDLPAQRPFDAVEHTRKVVKSLAPQATKMDVLVHIDPLAASVTSPLKGYGDTVQFAQIMSIVISNAIEAYETSAQSPRIVTVKFSAVNKRLIIRISDHGKGIPEGQRKLLFKPFTSNKKQGMGVGLYIAKTMLNAHFKGNIRLSQTSDRTEFVITIPVYVAP